MKYRTTHYRTVLVQALCLEVVATLIYLSSPLGTVFTVESVILWKDTEFKFLQIVNLSFLEGSYQHAQTTLIITRNRTKLFPKAPQ